MNESCLEERTAPFFSKTVVNIQSFHTFTAPFESPQKNKDSESEETTGATSIAPT